MLQRLNLLVENILSRSQKKKKKKRKRKKKERKKTSSLSLSPPPFSCVYALLGLNTKIDRLETCCILPRITSNFVDSRGPYYHLLLIEE
jgi:hypothetical protein